MTNNPMVASTEIEELDRIYREGGLRRMASPHIHYHDPNCPHPNCNHKMEWIDFRIELYGDKEGLYKPLVRAWWDGKGFAGRCPACSRWIHFTTLGMEALQENQADQFLHLPDNWPTFAQFA